MDEETLMNRIKNCFGKKLHMGLLPHKQAMDFFRRYVIVGGMPQAVAEFAETNNLENRPQIPPPSAAPSGRIPSRAQSPS